GKHAEVVEHRRLPVEVARALVDRQREVRVDGLTAASEIDQRPVEYVAGTRQRELVAGSFGELDRLTAETCGLLVVPLALAHGAERRHEPGADAGSLATGAAIKQSQAGPRRAHRRDGAAGALVHQCLVLYEARLEDQALM